MKIRSKLLLPCISCLGLMQCKAQGTDAGITEAEELFSKGSFVSEVLTSKTFLHLHPNRDFRQLIRAHADSNAVDISPAGEPGKKIRVFVDVVDVNGVPMQNLLVYFYQTDAKGWYAASSPHVGGNEGDMRQARLFGYGKTNSQGRLTFETVKPSGYPQSDLPAHIHIHFEIPGKREHVTELLFDDDERLIGNVRTQSIRYGFHIAKPEMAPAGFDQQFHYRIELK